MLHNDKKKNNRELRVTLYKFGLTDTMMANELGTARSTFNRKLNSATFKQKEMQEIVKILQRYDHTIDGSLFFRS